MGVMLAICTCGPQLEVALRSDAGAVPSTVRLAGISPRSTLLLAAIDLLMEDAGEDPGSIERTVVSRGPGSFTGIRAGLATAAGLAEATGSECLAYDSLLVQAARCGDTGVVWAAQPGRRGEVYARRYRIDPKSPPVPAGQIEVLAVAGLEDRGPWVAAENLSLGRAERVVAARSAAEALIRLVDSGMATQPLEPLYVEGPPIHRKDGPDG
jgi:tRNA threonylcarbamoyl adenosine modification protein YeaZ